MQYLYGIFGPASVPVSRTRHGHITEDFGLKINELIEHGPALQFPVEYLNHIDFAFTEIA